jgi:hypothetical protein
MAQVVQAAVFAVALPGRVDQRQATRRRVAGKRCSSATARFSAKPMPTKPLLATVSPSCTRASASAALTQGWQ